MPLNRGQYGMKKDKYDKPSFGDKAILTVLRGLRRKGKTVRTKAIHHGLGKSGINWAKDKPSAKASAKLARKNK